MITPVRSLLSPVRVGAWTLSNRVVMAPMTRSRADAAGVPGPLAATYYGQRASAGLVVAEAAQIRPDGQGYLRTPGIHAPAQVEAWRAVTEAVHVRGGHIVLQLWHVGRASHPDNRAPGTRTLGPSALAAPGTIFTEAGMKPFPVPEAMSVDDLAGVVSDYADAARRALDAGFDGVELHAANGYLIDQFLQSSSNRRDDGYGGSIGNRCRLLLDATDALCRAIGADRVGVRLSPYGRFNGVQDPDPEALFDTAIRRLSERGIAYLHVIEPEVTGDRSVRHHQAAVPSAGAFARDRFSGTLIVCGGFDVERAEAAIAAGQADLVAFGRPFIANPDLVERIGRRSQWVIPDRSTFYTEGAAGYIDYSSEAPAGA